MAGGSISANAAAQSNQDLLRRIQAMEQKLQGMQDVKQELQLLKEQLAKSQQTAKEQISTLQKKVAANQKTAQNATKEAFSEDTRDIKWHLGGAAKVDFTASNMSGQHDAFVGAEFAPIFLIGYKDLLLFEAETEITSQDDGHTKVELEFANLNLNVADWLTFTVGKFLSPIGDFQQHTHPSWINKLPDRPAGFNEDGGNLALGDVGIMARGAIPVGSMIVDYAVFVGNGPRLSDEPEEGVLLEGFGGGDNNGNKAVGGRIGIRPLPYISIGFSAMSSKVSGTEGSSGIVSTGSYNLEDIDAAFTKGNWDIRGEYVRAHVDSFNSAFDPADPTVMIDATTWHSWYVQAAYRLAGIANSEILGNLEPVFRYSSQSVRGFSDFGAGAEDRWTVGLNYWFAPSLVLKTAYENRNFKNEPTADVFRAAFAFGF
jgi:hypothetical protein